MTTYESYGERQATPRYVRVGDLVRELGLSASSWRAYADQGKVRAVKINGQRIFDLADCKRYLSGEPQSTSQASAPQARRERQKAFLARRAQPTESDRERSAS